MAGLTAFVQRSNPSARPDSVKDLCRSGIAQTDVKQYQNFEIKS